MSMSSFVVILVVLFWWTYFLFLLVLAFLLQMIWLFFHFLFDSQLVQIIPACSDNSMFCTARNAYFVAGRAANTVIPVITTALAHSILTVAILDTI